MTSSVELLVAVLVLLLPGAGLLLVLGVRDRVTLVGAAAPCTAGMALFAAILFASLGIGFGAGSFAVLTVLIVGVGAAVRYARRRRRPANSGTDSAPPATGGTEPLAESANGSADLRGSGRLTAQVLGWLAGGGAVGLGVWTWFRGMGAWSTPTQEHDPIVHSVATAYIHYTGSAAPWQVLPIDLLTQSPVSYYPAGFPAMSALVADFVGSPMTGMNLMTVAALAVAWPMSAAAFTAAGVRIAGYGRGWIGLAAGVAALIAAVLYRPGFAFAHDGGILPNAMAVVLVPGVLAALLSLGHRQWGKAVAIVVATGGIASIHPSGVVSLGLSAAVILGGAALTAAGRQRLRAALAPLGIIAVVAVLALIPLLLGASGMLGSVSGFPPDISAQTPPNAVGNALTLPYGGFYDPANNLTQLSLAILALAGLVGALLTRRGWALAAPWLLWVAITIDFQVSPTSGVGAAVGGFFYSSATRISAHTYLFTPGLVGFGAVAALCVLTARMPAVRSVFAIRHRAAGPPTNRPATAAVPVLACAGLALIAFFATTLVGYAKVNAHTVAQRYSTPQFTRYGPDDQAAVDWLDKHVGPGERIMNNANDGSTLAYVQEELPIVNDRSKGVGSAPYTIDLLTNFDTYPENQHIRSELLKLNVAWVYVDSQAPSIGNNNDRLGAGNYSLAPGLSDLAGLPGLTKVFTSGNVSVYHLSLGEVAAMGSSGG